MSTDRPSPSQAQAQHQQAALANELQALGRLLDSMERGSAPMSARQFRRAAIRAGEILSGNEDLTALRRVCSGCAPLRELLQNELMIRAQRDGTMRWMHSFRF